MLETKEVTAEDVEVLKAYIKDCMDRVAFGNTDFNRSYALALACMQEQVTRKEEKPFRFSVFHSGTGEHLPDMEGIVFADSRSRAVEKVTGMYGTGCIIKAADILDAVADDIYVFHENTINSGTDIFSDGRQVIQRIQQELSEKGSFP